MLKLQEKQKLEQKQSQKEAEMQRMLAVANEHRAMEQTAMALKALEEAKRKK